MELALIPNPTPKQIAEFQALGPLVEKLRPEQRVRLVQILESWGFTKHGLPVSKIRLAIRKVHQNWP